MEQKPFDIVGIGDADVDILLKIPRLPRHDEKIKGRIVGKLPGGVVSNFLCAASKFGARCAAMVRTGADEFGRMALEDLERHGVDTRRCICYPDKSTYFTVSCLDESGEKCMLVCMDDETTQPAAEDLDYDFLGQTRFVHMIGTYEDLVLAVARRGKEKGFLLSLDIERQNREIPVKKIREIASLTHIAFPNEEGIRYFTGLDDVTSGARRLLDWGCKIVVVTLGSRGVYVCTETEAFHVPAFQVPVADTTGAGDTFNASFLASLSRGRSLRQCAYLAAASAALQIQRIGARTGMVSMSEAEAFLQAQGIGLNQV